MKKLSRKVNLTIFFIISLFLLLIITVYNVENYQREYNNIRRNLTFIEDNGHFPKQMNENIVRPEKDLNNMMIMDYEVYTVRINNNQIDQIIGHNNNSSNFDVKGIAEKIMSNEKDLVIGNIYTSKYAYNYTLDNTIVIMNTESISNKLKINLCLSCLLFIISEIIIYFITKLITKWITKPALESFNKQKEFIADASHELKTPLAIIMASSDELKSDKKNQKYIDNIKYESERMNKLITNLLDLSKLESNVKTNYKEENISKIINKIALTFEAIAFENSLSLELNIEDNIMYKCNKDDIEKLVSIILDNAIKHSYKNTSILISLKKDKNINLEIINTGDPINPGDEEKIFERFYRVDKSRNRDANRYGLGLAIAKSIVTNHNGIIKASSKENRTTFKITLNSH